MPLIQGRQLIRWFRSCWMRIMLFAVRRLRTLFAVACERRMRVRLTRRRWAWYIGSCGRAGNVRVHDGACSSVGGTPGCGPGGRGFKPRQAPRLFMSGDSRVKENPELGPFGLVRGFLLLSCGKVPADARACCRLTPAVDETSHLSADRTVGGLWCFGANNRLRSLR